MVRHGDGVALVGAAPARVAFARMSPALACPLVQMRGSGREGPAWKLSPLCMRR